MATPAHSQRHEAPAPRRTPVNAAPRRRSNH